MATKAAPARKRYTGIPLSAAMILVTQGVVYGDIGTSPMYTLKAIISGNGGLSTMSQDVVLGALSLIIWTLTLITTVKYVLVAMKADNHNEGGIFALYSLVKRCGRWLIIPAMIGGAALLADGILTPAAARELLHPRGEALVPLTRAVPPGEPHGQADLVKGPRGHGGRDGAARSSALEVVEATDDGGNVVGAAALRDDVGDGKLPVDEVREDRVDEGKVGLERLVRGGELLKHGGADVRERGGG